MQTALLPHQPSLDQVGSAPSMQTALLPHQPSLDQVGSAPSMQTALLPHQPSLDQACKTRHRRGPRKKTPTLTGRENQPIWSGDENPNSGFISGIEQTQPLQVPLCHMELTPQGWQESNPLLNPTVAVTLSTHCLLYTSPSPRDGLLSRMPSSA